MQKLLISIDLNSLRLTKAMLDNILEEYKFKYDIFSIIFYNYSKARHTEFNNYPKAKYNFSSGGRKKVQLDYAQAMDITQFFSNNQNCHLFLICGYLGSEFLIKKLKEMNIYTIIGANSKITSDADYQYILDRSSLIEENLPLPYDNKTKIFTHEAAQISPITDTKVEKPNALDAITKLLSASDKGTSDEIRMKLENMLKFVNTNKSEILKTQYEKILKNSQN